MITLFMMLLAAALAGTAATIAGLSTALVYSAMLVGGFMAYGLSALFTEQQAPGRWQISTDVVLGVVVGLSLAWINQLAPLGYLILLVLGLFAGAMRSLLFHTWLLSD